MPVTSLNKFLPVVLETFETAFGQPTRKTVKIVAWDISQNLSAVVQIDQPAKDQYALVWLPYPSDGSTIPEIAMEYPGEAGRHSNTYASPSLKRGLPVLRLKLASDKSLNETIKYITAFRDSMPLPEVKEEAEASNQELTKVDPSKFPEPKAIASRREAIPRTVQREVWQRDVGKCVECGTREKLCFDHIVPFSRGGGNTVRNVQLLCERCNLSKGNRL